MLRLAHDTGTTQSAELMLSLRGRQLSIAATYVPMRGECGTVRQVLGLLHDFTKRRQTEERLAFMAQYDSLTGLPNRYLLLDRLEAAMQRARRNETLLGVMILDIDRFKQINDSRGHATGDILLQQVAERLASTLRATDTIARLGGDEFTVLVENATSIDEITAIADKIKNAFATPFETESGEVFTTTSVGITIFPFDDHNRDELLKNADVAMYHAKQERNNWQLYRADMNVNTEGRLGMEVELRRALERDEFQLYFQPQIAVKTGEFVGMEALIRWDSKTLGRVSPADFIPIAEDSGLIVPIGEWILRAAAEQCKRWERSGLDPFTVSVNISAPQFRRSNLLQVVSTVLTQCHLDARWLGLEITESSIMKHAEQTIQTLVDLRELGVAIAIDDFGTGYSSLSYLKRFPVNKIKVDQSFVRDISSDPNDAAIVSAVVAMSKQLGIRTIAEGVETAEQLAFLSRLECDEYQGYYFSKPIPAAEVAPLILARKLKSAAA
jgi:diguanylate cyclase (GGDEF)-like protein